MNDKGRAWWIAIKYICKAIATWAVFSFTPSIIEASDGVVGVFLAAVAMICIWVF